MKPQERAKQLTEAHWSYVGKTLEVHGLHPRDIEAAKHHYLTSGQHFYLHSVEDCENNMFGMFCDDVALEAELDRSCGDAAADAAHASRTKELFTRGCPSCLDTADCGKNMKTDHAGRCLYHRPNLRERILDAKQETPLPDMGCMNIDCCDHSLSYLRNCAAYLPGAMRQCEKYTTAKQEVPTAAEHPLDFTLPSIALKCTAEEAHRKYCEENAEWLTAKTGSMEELVERWDCLQALRTYAERGGDVNFCQEEEKYICHDLTAYHAKGRDVMGAKELCLVKNADRGYYSRAVNKRIMLTDGASFTPKEG